MTPDDTRPPDSPSDTPPAADEALALALQRLARPADESGVWPALQPRVARARRRRNVTRAVGAIAVIAVLGLAGWQGSRLTAADRTAEVTIVTHPAAPDGGMGPAATLPGPSGGIILPTDSADPRVDVIRRFVNALSAGDTATAWSLLDPGSQALGTEETLAGISSDLGRQWATSTNVQYQVIDGEPYTGKRLAVVTLFGTINLAGQSSQDLTTFQVMTGADGEPRVALVGYQARNVVYDPYEWLHFTVPARPSGTALTTEDALKFVVPTEPVHSSSDASLDVYEAIRKVPGPIVLAVDGDLVGPSQWQEKDGRGTYLPQYSGPGDHVATLVQFQDDGYVNVASATYTVVNSPATADTTLPRTPTGVTPYHGDDWATQNATEVLNTYLKAVRDGDEAAFAATLYPLDKGAAADLFAGERALYKDNGDQAFLLITDSIRYNWWQDGGWFYDWAPYDLADGTLSAVGDLSSVADWLQGRPPARFVAVVTMVDGSIRTFAFEIGDGVKLRAESPASMALPTATVTTSGTATTTR